MSYRYKSFIYVFIFISIITNTCYYIILFFPDSPAAIILRFTENSYVGTYNKGQLEMPIISLLDSNAYSNINITGGNY